LVAFQVPTVKDGVTAYTTPFDYGKRGIVLFLAQI
jgi:hypothetical protein